MHIIIQGFPSNIRQTKSVIVTNLHFSTEFVQGTTHLAMHIYIYALEES